MSITVQALRELHRLHRQLTDVRDRLARGPKQVEVMTAQVKRLEEELAAAKEAVKKARMASDEKNLQLREREARIKDLRSKQNACTANREYQAYKEQIAADEQANSVLTDEILESLDKIEQMQMMIPVADANLAKGREDAERVTQRVAAEKSDLEAELARLTADLKTAEDNLPAEFKPDYFRAVRGRGEEGMAPLDGVACGGCYQTVTPNMHQNLVAGRPAFCKSCGRLLYMPEERGAK